MYVYPTSRHDACIQGLEEAAGELAREKMIGRFAGALKGCDIYSNHFEIFLILRKYVLWGHYSNLDAPTSEWTSQHLW